MTKTKYIKQAISGAVLGCAAVCLTALALPHFTKPPAFHNARFFARPDSVLTPGRIVSDVDGALEEIIIHFSGNTAAPGVLAAYRDLFRQLPAEVKTYVACPAESDFKMLTADLYGAGVSAGKRFIPVITNCPITCWARDRFLAKAPDKAGIKAELVLPPRPEYGCDERSNDWFVSWKLASDRPAEFQVEKSRLYFHGGDLINAGRFIFADYNLFKLNLSHSSFSDAKEFSDYLGQRFGYEPVLVGDAATPVPEHHIEMYITPLDDRTVLVGDPDLAMRLLDKDKPDISSQVDPSLFDAFRNVAGCLRDKGFSVVPIPILPTKTPHVFISYNNVIIDNRAGVKTVYLPTYNIPELDNCAVNIWQAQGFIVKRIDASGIYRLGGAIRCLVNVLSRA
ncbi:MAG: hypothetical protein V1701_03290 [Planctomycetota bacterium]